RAIGSFAATVSTATTRDAPAIARAWIALSPTPPTPNTTAVSPRCTCAAFHTEPAPVITPQAMRHADVSGTSSGIGTAWISWMTVRSASDDVAAKLEHGSPWNVNGSVRLPIDDRQRGGWPVVHGRHLPQFAIVDTTMWSPGFVSVTDSPTASTMPAPSWPIAAGPRHGIGPARTARGVWHSPAATMRPATSYGPGARTSSASVSSAVPSPA